VYAHCLLAKLIDEDDDEDDEEDNGDDEGGTGLGSQNKVLKSEVSKHKQQLERLQEKVGFLSPQFFCRIWMVLI